MNILKADVEASGKPRYKNWSLVPEGLKTKTQWSQDGRRLCTEAEPAGYVWSPQRNTHFELYNADAVEPKREQSPGIVHPLTPETIGAALYEINKAAKRRCDAAAAAYARRHHGVAGTQRFEKERLYDLKDKVLSKAKEDGMAQFVGYHVKHDQFARPAWREPDGEASLDGPPEDEFCGGEGFEQDETRSDGLGYGGRRVTVVEEKGTAMALFELGGFRFHTILNDLPTGAETQVTDLGAWMSAATPRTRHMTLKDAEATLNAFLGKRSRSKLEPETAP